MARVLFALMVLTAAEVALAWAGLRGAAMLALLLAMSAAKAALILGWFMHLRSEPRRLGLALLPIAIVAMLLLAAVFPDSDRMAQLRDGAAVEVRGDAARTR